MKTKHVIIVWLIGFSMLFIGALFKIQHWPFAGVILMIGTLLQVIGIFLFAYKLYKYTNKKDFLNF